MNKGVTAGLLIGFILGVATGPFFNWHNLSTPLWLVVGLILLAAVYWRYYRYFALAVLILVVALLGNLRFSFNHQRAVDNLSQFSGQVVRLVGVVVSDPLSSQQQVKLTVQVRSINGEATHGKVLVTVPVRPSFEYGNLLSLDGRLDLPVNRSSFDYVGYLARFGISATMSYPTSNLIQSFVGNPIMRQLYIVKHQLISVVQATLPEPAAALLTGLLFGAKSDLSPELMDDFSRVGLTHIIALSGFNITIITAGLLWLLRFLSLKWRYGLAMLAIVLFVLMTGASPSVTRAAIMGVLVLWAGLVGRLADTGVTLLLAATIMLLANPLVLYHDVGFQLSFAATVGMVYLSPVFNDIFRRLPKWFNGYLSPTLAALVFSTPLLVYQFGKLSLIAPLSNILVLPFISIAMGLGFIGVLLGLIYLPAGILFGWLSVWPLNYIVGVTVALSGLPAAAIEIKITSVWWVAVAYAILGAGLISKQIYAPKIDQQLRSLVAAR